MLTIEAKILFYKAPQERQDELSTLTV